MKALHMIAWVLVMIGALNWGLVGLGGFLGGNWNVVNLLLGSWLAIEWLVYVLVGLSAIYEIATHWSRCKTCGSGSAGTM
jgi:uncharacterized membrane protein YuzA (DUF378 family)